MRMKRNFERYNIQNEKKQSKSLRGYNIPNNIRSRIYKRFGYSINFFYSSNFKRI